MIHPRQVLHVLLTLTATLVVLSITGQAMVYYLPDFLLRDGIANLLHVDNEQSLPTLYSSITLLTAAALFGVFAYAHGRGDRVYVRHWAALSIVFVLLAIDESAGLHEQNNEPLRELLGIERGPLWFAWVIPGALAVALFALSFLRFLLHLPRATRRRVWVAGVLYVGGAIGVELVGGSYSAIHGQLNMTYALIATIEETLEMLGIAVLVYALLAYIPVDLPDVDWRFRVAAGD